MTDTLQSKECPACEGTGLVGTVNKHTCTECTGTGKVYTEGNQNESGEVAGDDDNDQNGGTTDAEKGPDDGGIVGMILGWFGLRFALSHAAL